MPQAEAGVMKIPLTNSEKFALVSLEDYVEQIRYKWCLTPDGYVRRHGKDWGMQRFIMNLKRGDKLKVHHIDHNKLNNTRSNLVVLSSQEHGFAHSSKCGDNATRTKNKPFSPTKLYDQNHSQR